MIELAEIFQHYGPAYRAKFGERLLPSHRQAMWAIEHCRTAALGGQVYHCPDCDHDVYQYHSCRNRHCPKCQNEQAQRWLEQQWAMLLPVPYFMLTFTLPAALRPIARQHQTLIYDRLFRSSAAATQHLADDPRFIGGQLGLVGVLHTWGRTLTYHPHVHYLVPAGGWLAETRTWQPARDDFLVPVKALSGILPMSPPAAGWAGASRPITRRLTPHGGLRPNPGEGVDNRLGGSLPDRGQRRDGLQVSGSVCVSRGLEQSAPGEGRG